MAGAVMAYLYSSGTAGEFDATQTIQLTDAGGGPVSLTLSGPALLDDALTEWQALANASATLSETYTISRSGEVITIAATGAFDYELDGDLPNALGLAQSDSGSSSYSGTDQPLTYWSALAVDCSPAEYGDISDLAEYRHGRVDSHIWGNHDLLRVSLYLTASTEDGLRRSYCAAGKVRLWQDAGVATAYSATNPAGYVDGFVAGMSEPRTLEFDESIVVVDMLLAVGR